MWSMHVFASRIIEFLDTQDFGIVCLCFCVFFLILSKGKHAFFCCWSLIFFLFLYLFNFSGLLIWKTYFLGVWRASVYSTVRELSKTCFILKPKIECAVFFLTLQFPAFSLSYEQLSNTNNQCLMSTSHKLYAYRMYLCCLNVHHREGRG